MKIITTYFWNVLIAIDQLGNTLLFGDPDETISSRAGKWSGSVGWRGSVSYYLCRALHWVDKGHCAKSIESDEGDRGLL